MICKPSALSGLGIGVGEISRHALGNGAQGINIGNGRVVGGSGGSNATIGGTTAAARNIVSANKLGGIAILGAGLGNVIQGNYIGTDITGTEGLGNINFGVNVNTGPITIGGIVAGAGNVISANIGTGLDISALRSSLVAGNFIGTDYTGTQALGNSGSGLIQIAGGNSNGVTGSANTIGGTTDLGRNIISANGEHGIYLAFGTAQDLVQGNYIGTDVTGTQALGNTGNGVYLFAASGNTFRGNVIAANGAGVVVQLGSSDAIGNALTMNSIYANTGLGIDLVGGTGAANVVTANDTGDADAGSNNLQNFPVLSGAISLAGTTTVTGSLNSTANATFRLEFFSNAALDPSGFGEGQTFLGAEDVVTDVGGNAAFRSTFPTAVPVGHFLSATATDSAGNTSEFSGARVVVAGDQPPNADAGGPYHVLVGATVALAASGTFDVDEPNTDLTFQWDLDGDTRFGETAADPLDADYAARGNETGATPMFNAEGLGTTIWTVGLRVTDSTGKTGSDTATVNVVDCVDAPNGLASWWRAEGNANDTFGTNHGALLNGAIFATGKVGQSFANLDSQNNYVSIPSSPQLTLNGSSSTLENWINDEIHADGGNDVILAGAGHDEVKAGSGNDIVVGGDGDDVLDGGIGRDLLIGGRGRDCLSGGNGDDILIGGYTNYDSSLWALDRVMAEWSGAASYGTRVANITSGGGSLVGLGVLLNDTTVHDDNDYDVLAGDGDRDLFFYNFDGAGTKDKAKDIKTSGSQSETRVDID